MAITKIGPGEVGSANNGGTVTLTPSTAPIEGDYILACGGIGTSDAGDTFGVTTAGYTLIASEDWTSDEAIAVGFWYKKMGATPDTTVVFGGGDATDTTWGACLVLRGVDATTFLDAAAVFFFGPDVDVDPAAITTVTDGAWVVPGYAAADWHVPATSGPSGYSGFLGVGAIDTNRGRLGIAHKEITTAGVEDPGIFGDAGNHKGWTVAVRPASAAGPQTITGVLLARSPTFPTGAVNPGNVTTVGTLLTRSGTFPTGSVQASNTVIGLLLSRSPTFPTGTITPGNVTTVGTLLSRSPSFPTGAVTPGNVNLTGILLSRSPTFPTGTITPGNVTVGGSLLSRSPTFPTGVVSAEITVGGSLLTRSPTFPTGSVSLDGGPQTITGSLLSRSPTFLTGSVNATNTVVGVLLSRSPTFPTGTVSSAIVVTGVLLARSPTFPTGVLTGGVQLVHLQGLGVVVLVASTGDVGLDPSLSSVDLDSSTAWAGLDRSLAKS